MAIRNKSVLFALLTATSLSACSSYVVEKQKTEAETAVKVEKTNTRTKEALERYQELRATERPSNVRVREGVYLGEQGSTRFRGSPLPAAIEGPSGVMLSTPGEVGLSQFAVLFETATGLRVDYSDLLSYEPGAASTSTIEPLEGSIPPAAAALSSGSGREILLDKKFDVRFRGPASRLLDMVSTRIGADWEFRNGIVRFLGPQTITYTIWTLPIAMQADSSVGETAGGEGGSSVFGSSSPAKTTSAYAFNYWENFESGLKAIMADSSASYAINKASGALVITASRSIHERVSEFVERENGRLSRQVAIKVDIISFDAVDSDERNMDITGALSRVFSKNVGVTLSTAPQTIAGASILGLNISGGDLSGSEALLGALSTFGRTSLEASASVVATNNMPTPLSISSDRAYLASVQRTVDDNGDSTTSLESGIISSGLNIVMTPRIMSGGDVFLNYSINVSELRDIEEFTSPDGLSSVQLPLVNNRNIIQNLTLRSGDTTVVAVYDSEGGSFDSRGPFNAAAWAAGGNAAWNNNTTRILILMTPIVMEPQNAQR